MGGKSPSIRICLDRKSSQDNPVAGPRWPSPSSGGSALARLKQAASHTVTRSVLRRSLFLSSTLTTTATTMPASDIDSIFASSKGKGKAKLASEPLPSPSAPAANSKTANQKKRKRIDAGRSEQQSAPKRKAAETVVDPSLRLSAKASAPATKPASDKLSKKRKKADEAEERFKDSRGTRPSMSSVVIMCASRHDTTVRTPDRRRFSHIQGERARYYGSGRRYVLQLKFFAGCAYERFSRFRYTSLSVRLRLL